MWGLGTSHGEAQCAKPWSTRSSGWVEGDLAWLNKPVPPGPRTMQAAALSELEGTALVDDGKGCGAAFVVLRSLAQAWLDDASRHSNV